MKKRLLILVLMPFIFCSWESEPVTIYKASLSAPKIMASKKSILSKYLIQYPSLENYRASKMPPQFKGVLSTITTSKLCKSNTFEYNLFVNRNIFELDAIENSISNGMSASGFLEKKSNEFGVKLWDNKSGVRVVSILTKITPFTFVNSSCEV